MRGEEPCTQTPRAPCTCTNQKVSTLLYSLEAASFYTQQSQDGHFRVGSARPAARPACLQYEITSWTTPEITDVDLMLTLPTSVQSMNKHIFFDVIRTSNA